MTYAALAEGSSTEDRKDLDHALLAEPGPVTVRQRGARELQNMLMNPPGRPRR